MRRLLLLLCWLISDLVLFVAAFAFAYFIRVGFVLSTDFPMDKYMQIVVAIAPLWLAVVASLGVFRLARVQTSAKNMSHLLFAAFIGLSFFTLGYYFVYNQFFSRLLLIYAGALSFIFPVVWHVVFDQFQRRSLRRDPPVYPLLIIGANRDAERMIRLLEERQSPFKPVAVLDSQGTSRSDIAGVPVKGRLNKLEEVIKELKITHLMQCAELEHTINLVSVCHQHGIKYLLLPMVLGIVTEESENIEGQGMIAVTGK